MPVSFEQPSAPASEPHYVIGEIDTDTTATAVHVDLGFRPSAVISGAVGNYPQMMFCTEAGFNRYDGRFDRCYSGDSVIDDTGFTAVLNKTSKVFYIAFR